LLLILDRKDDPVTPLLMQWTYQAMMHELLGIYNSRVDLRNVPGVKKELTEVVMNAEQDPWYKENLYCNFGELGANIKKLIDEYAQKQKSNEQINSLEDIKKFVEQYPEFKKLAGNVSKHVAVLQELSRLVGKHHLLEISEIEQDISMNDKGAQFF